ncbi:MAG: tyrosine-type recombinase/integrase [Promethearchaeota archaeon]
MPRISRHNRASFEQDSLVVDWLTTVSPGTAPSYSLSLLYFCAFTKRTPKQLIEDEQAYRQQPVLNRDSSLSGRHRLEHFRQWLLKDHPEHVLVFDQGPYAQGEKPFTKKTRRTISRMVGCIKSFYRHYDVSLPQLHRFTRSQRQVAGGLTTGEIAKVLEYADVRAKALIFVAATTGRSSSDLLELKLGDIDRGKFPNWGFIHDPDQPRQKTGIEMISWITPEALQHLDRYLKTRSDLTPESYLFVEKPNEQERKLTKNAAGAMLRRLGKKVFPDQRENPLSLRALRSWFGTQLDHNPGGYTHKQILMAHSVPYNGAYAKPTIDQLFKSVRHLYENGFTRILAVPEGYDLEAIEGRIRGEIQPLIDELQQERTRLKEVLEDQERAVPTLKQIDENPEMRRLLLALAEDPKTQEFVTQRLEELSETELDQLAALIEKRLKKKRKT